MGKKKAIALIAAVFAAGFIVGGFAGKYCANHKAPETFDFKKDLAKIRALQKEIASYADKDDSDKAKKLRKEFRDFRDKKIYLIDKQNLELEARYWAGRILNDKDVSFEELAVYSVNWAGDGNLNKELMMIIKYYVEDGYVKPLTKEEKEIFDRNKDMVWALYAPGAFDMELINSLSEQNCIDIISARGEEKEKMYNAVYYEFTEMPIHDACERKMNPNHRAHSIKI